MEFNTSKVDLIANRKVTPSDLPAFCEEVKQMAPSKVSQRICEEVATVVNTQKMQTISWTQIFIDVAAPAFIDRLVFHESGRVVRLDRREILFNEMLLIKKVSQLDMDSKYTDFSFWKDWQSEKQIEVEYWEYEKAYGPPEWAIGTGVALVRNGKIVDHYELDCSF